MQVFKDNAPLWLVGYRRGDTKDPKAIRGQIDAGAEMWCGGITDIMKYDNAARKLSHGEPMMKWNLAAKSHLPNDFSIQAREGWGIMG